MTRTRFLQLLSGIRTGKHGGVRAPHKPLLLLLALGRVTRGQSRLASFGSIQPALDRLLRLFGAPRKATHPEFPFGRLRNDGLWEIPGDVDLSLTRSGDLLVSELRGRDIKGGFPTAVQYLLEADRTLVFAAIQGLLAEHFPPSLHNDIREAAGIPWDWTWVGQPPVSWPRRTQRVRERDPAFRAEVLKQYEHRCAICDFDIRLDDRVFGLEAAHIQWHSHEGPDEVSNGLALCLLHHKALDRGALGLEGADTGFQVLVSSQVGGSSPATNELLDLQGKPIRPPLERKLAPSSIVVAWHRKQVFRNPPLSQIGAQFGAT